MMGLEDLNRELTQSANAVNAVIDELLVEGEGYENRVVEAMRYACLGEGKRVRPFLV